MRHSALAFCLSSIMSSSVTQLLPGAVSHDKAGVQFFYRPGRAGRRRGIHSRWHHLFTSAAALRQRNHSHPDRPLVSQIAEGFLFEELEDMKAAALAVRNTANLFRDYFEPSRVFNERWPTGDNP